MTRFWTISSCDYICDWDACVAVPRGGADPLGIRAWLEAQGQLLERYEWMDYRDHGGLGLAGGVATLDGTTARHCRRRSGRSEGPPASSDDPDNRRYR